MEKLKNGTRYQSLRIKRFSHFNKDENENYYICTCDCGRETAVKQSSLINGTAIACGQRACYANMLNQHYGQWTVIDVNKNFKPKVKARCTCGTEKLVNAADLRNEKSKSCGCSRNNRYKQQAELHVGETYGRLTIIAPILKKGESAKQNKYYYRCKCECGNEITVAGQHLFSGHTSSCGCLKSSANEQMTKILTKLKIPFKAEYRIAECKDKALLPFDFAIFNEADELIGLIENNGGQHYAEVGRGFYTRAKLDSIRHHDYIKQKFCEDNQIPLLIIPYQYFGDKMEEFFRSSHFCQSVIGLKFNDQVTNI